MRTDPIQGEIIKTKIKKESITIIKRLSANVRLSFHLVSQVNLDFKKSNPVDRLELNGGLNGGLDRVQSQLSNYHI